MLLVIAPALVTVVVLGWRNIEHVRNDARQQALSLAHQAATDFHPATEARHLVATLSAVPVFSEPGKSCNEFLARVLRRNKAVTNIGIINTDGDLACSAVPFQGRLYLGARTFFQSAMRGADTSAVTDRSGAAVKAPMLVYAAPLPGSGENPAGVVYAAIKLSRLGRIAESAHLPPGSTLTTLDHSGHVLARAPDAGRWLGRQVPLFSQLVGSLDGNASLTTDRSGPDGVRRLYAVYAPASGSRGSGLYVVVGMPDARILAGARHSLIENLSIVGAMAVLLLAIGWFAADRLVLRKIASLTGAVRRLSSGDSNARARLDGDDEIAQLGEVFDGMAERLGLQADQLRDQMQRTERINRVYRVLSGINTAILRLRDDEALLHEACRIAVEVGGLRMAWAGRVNGHASGVRLMAHAGVGRAAVEDMIASMNEGLAEGRGTVGPALLNRKPIVCDDIAADPRMTPWRDDLLALECRSVATFPLWRGRDLVGSLTFYADEPGYFDSEEIPVYEEVAADTSLGLEFAHYAARQDYLAYHDPITGLPNRALFRDRIQQAIIAAKRQGDFPAVLAVEIPEVQKLSDHFGHHVADQALRALVPRLTAVLREGDSLARLEGHAFAVGLVAQTRSSDDANAIASRVLQLFPLELEFDDKSFVVTARVGISVYPASGSDVQTMIRNAELAVHALEPGRQVGFYSRELDATLRRRHQVEQALARADLDREMRVVYQPVVDLDNENVIGAEALLRWTSPALGDVPPGEFIPVAEQVGRVEMLGRWVLRQVLAQVRDWQLRGLEFGTISVNVAAPELRQRDFIGTATRLLEESGVDTSNRPVALELTETTAIESMETVVEALEKLRDIGFQIYLDDFGTGYSSLAHLHRIPTHALKIDIDFIRRLADDNASLSLTRGSIMLAHSLGLRAIAEGVETAEQFRILKELRCNEAQGYLFSPPVAPLQFTELLKDRMTA